MEDLKILHFIGFLVFAYLFGAIPWGLVLTRIFTSVDIRQEGSGNIGATNVRRIAGTSLGLVTLACDVLKGAIPVYIAGVMPASGDLLHEIFICLAALSAFLGHLYPVYMKFKKGGKGVATATGCFLVLSPVACIVALLVFLLVAWWSNYVSAGSLSAVVILPVAVWIKSNSFVMTACAAVMSIFIIFRHKDNIKRLLSGTENVIRRGKK